MLQGKQHDSSSKWPLECAPLSTNYIFGLSSLHINTWQSYCRKLARFVLFCFWSEKKSNRLLFDVWALFIWPYKRVVITVVRRWWTHSRCSKCNITPGCKPLQKKRYLSDTNGKSRKLDWKAFSPVWRVGWLYDQDESANSIQPAVGNPWGLVGPCDCWPKKKKKFPLKYPISGYKRFDCFSQGPQGFI